MPSRVPDARQTVKFISRLECPCQCPATVKQFARAREWARHALSMMTRDRNQQVAPVKHPKLTKEQEAEILRLNALDPTLHQQDIAVLVGTNAGRVSEVLNGLRKGI
jgi:hypothetical protein